jgi:pimeloyl-ACP methyl ester carboxylesterase
MSRTRSVFKTPEGEAAYLAAYGAAMKLWSVPYDEMEIPSRFGMTHVVVSGPKDAPPLVLLHGYMGTLTMWSPNIADFWLRSGSRLRAYRATTATTLSAI